MMGDSPSSVSWRFPTTQSLPPIERLPEEILNEIFFLCLPYPHYRAKPSPSEAPLLLTHICRHWRKSAHNLALLWSSLDLEVQLRLAYCIKQGRFGAELKMHDFSAFSEGVATWFSYSKGFPFTLQFAYDYDTSKRLRAVKGQLEQRSLEESTRRALERDFQDLQYDSLPRPLPGSVHPLLIPIQPYLANLTLHNVPLMDLHPLARGFFPMLERLALSLTVGMELKDIDINPSIPPLYAFTDSPRLRSVAAKNLPPGDHIKLPWAQLTHFFEFRCYADPTWHFLYTHIHSVTSLRHLHISLDEFHARHSCNIPGWQAGRSSLPFKPVFLPELLKLSIYCPRWHSRSMKPEFWPRFDFPNLEALQIIGYTLNMGGNIDASGWWEPTDIEAFTRKFQGWTHLTHLSLQGVGCILVGTLRVILSAMPSLTVLDFEAHYEHLSALAFGLDPATHLAPELRHAILQFDDNTIDGSQWIWGVLELVESRLEARRDQFASTEDGGLQKVTIYASDPTSKYVLDAVEGMSEENMDGMRIEVEVRQKRTDLYDGWQSWSDVDEAVRGWPGLEDIAVKDGF